MIKINVRAQGNKILIKVKHLSPHLNELQRWFFFVVVKKCPKICKTTLNYSLLQTSVGAGVQSVDISKPNWENWRAKQFLVLLIFLGTLKPGWQAGDFFLSKTRTLRRQQWRYKKRRAAIEVDKRDQLTNCVHVPRECTEWQFTSSRVAYTLEVSVWDRHTRFHWKHVAHSLRELKGDRRRSISFFF